MEYHIQDLGLLCAGFMKIEKESEVPSKADENISVKPFSGIVDNVDIKVILQHSKDQHDL